MPDRFVAEVSGHSTKVCAAQDLAELDIDLAAITQAGGWKSTRMPAQYAEKNDCASQVHVGAIMSRGIVIGGGFRTVGKDGIEITTEDLPALLKHSLLYWDHVEWPDDDFLSVSHRDAEFLMSAGVLTRTRVERKGLFTGNLTTMIPQVLAQGQIEVFRRLEDNEPGKWSLAQTGEKLTFPAQDLPEQRALQVRLYNLLPTPDELVPFAEILTVRERYSSELHTLREHVDELYDAVVSSGDQSRAFLVAKDRLANAINHVDAALVGRGIATRRCSMKVAINPTKIIGDALAGGALAAVNSLPMSVGAGIGAITGLISFDYPLLPVLQSAVAGPLAYVYKTIGELK